MFYKAAVGKHQMHVSNKVVYILLPVLALCLQNTEEGRRSQVDVQANIIEKPIESNLISQNHCRKCCDELHTFEESTRLVRLFDLDVFSPTTCRAFGCNAKYKCDEIAFDIDKEGSGCMHGQNFLSTGKSGDISCRGGEIFRRDLIPASGVNACKACCYLMKKGNHFGYEASRSCEEVGCIDSDMCKYLPSSAMAGCIAGKQFFDNLIYRNLDEGTKYTCDIDNGNIIVGPVETPEPSVSPVVAPSFSPTTRKPTQVPTMEPTWATEDPTMSPSILPTITPSHKTKYPTEIPTFAPTNTPTLHPTEQVTEGTWVPSYLPTFLPTESPTFKPTSEPDYIDWPSYLPTSTPSLSPTFRPTATPSSTPTDAILSD